MVNSSIAIGPDVVARYAPYFIFHEDETSYPCSIEHLLVDSTLVASDGSVIKSNPTQADLSAGSSDFGKTRHVDINPSQYAGLPLSGDRVVSPLYYAVQAFEDVTVIHYLVLYAFQGGQTCRALRAGTEFNCIVSTLGEHQGDLERVAVVLSNDGTTVYGVEYEAHGDVSFYAPALINWQNGTHPIVHVALNGHAHRNLARVSSPVYNERVPGLVGIIEEYGQGATWDAAAVNDLRLLSLVNGQPQGNQVWANFGGRLGKFQTNSLQSATYYNHQNLNGFDWAFVKIIDFGAKAFGQYSTKILEGDGPEGPAVRPWVQAPAAGASFFGPALTVLSTNGDLLQGPGAIRWLVADIDADGADEVVQCWGNGSALGMIVYAVQENGQFACRWSSDDMGQGPGAVQWLVADLDGDGRQEIVQCWGNGSALGMIVYAASGDGLASRWANPDMGQGPGAERWLVGDFDGDGRDEIVQCWANGNALAMILYASDSDAGLTTRWSNTDMGQGPGAVRWLVGDFDGDGKDEIVQCWGNGNALGMILYASDGAGGLTGRWANAEIGQGPGAVKWLVGDVNGDSKDEIVQCWGNGNALGMIVYGSDGAGGLAVLWANPDLGQGPGAVAWSMGDFDRAGRKKIVQCWRNGSALGMILYDNCGSGPGLSAVWWSEDMGEGPGAQKYLSGRFAVQGRDRIVQLWDNGNLASIQYGTPVQE